MVIGGSRSDDGAGVSAYLTLGEVDLRGLVVRSEVSVVGFILDLDVCVRRLGLEAVVGLKFDVLFSLMELLSRALLGLFVVRLFGDVHFFTVLGMNMLFFLDVHFFTLLGTMNVLFFVDVHFFTLLGTMNVLFFVEMYFFTNRRTIDALFFVDMNFFTDMRTMDALFFVDMDFFTELGTMDALFFVDAYLFLDVGVTLLGTVGSSSSSSSEGLVDLFATFPSL
jgi:hypothetical protein